LHFNFSLLLFSSRNARSPSAELSRRMSVFNGNDIRGLEQNPETKSRWAQIARSGNKLVQFLSKGRYVANVVDGKVTLYCLATVGCSPTREVRLNEA